MIGRIESGQTSFAGQIPSQAQLLRLFFQPTSGCLECLSIEETAAAEVVGLCLDGELSGSNQRKIMLSSVKAYSGRPRSAQIYDRIPWVQS